MAIRDSDAAGAEGWTLKRLVISVGVQATIIATASFMFHSLLPGWLKDSPLRMFIAAVALFIANTFPAAILRRFTGEAEARRIVEKFVFLGLPVLPG